MWRYLPWLPVPQAHSLGEPETPLVVHREPGAEALLKLESALPTGSFKDRGAAVLVAWLSWLGIRDIVDDSSGNAGAALCAYAAAAGIAVRVFVPATASRSKLVQMRATGADVVPVPGPRQAATDAAIAAADDGRFYASHAWSPHYIAGTATFAWELWERFDRQVPDAVVVPVGGGSLLLGLARGFSALVDAGLETRTPRLFGVQVEACAPLAKAFKAGAGEAIAVEAQPSMAEGILLTDPPRGRSILTAVRSGGGAIVAVDDEAAWHELERSARRGLVMEPTSAVALAGLRRLRNERLIGADEIVVVAVTGAGLKATDPIDLRLAG